MLPTPALDTATTSSIATAISSTTNHPCAARRVLAGATVPMFCISASFHLRR
jgi:hypothetical protein